MTLTPKHDGKPDGGNERWVHTLLELAERRGDTSGVAQKAVSLSRQLNISPWLALALAERVITMNEARLLDRVGRCKELQSAILDQRRPLDELKVLMPYAAHFLADELLAIRKGQGWDVRTVVRILDGLLNAEQKTGDAYTTRVRNLSVEEYAAAVERALGVMRRTRCDTGLALDVEAGRVTEQFATDYMRRKRDLENEERRLMAPPTGRPSFPVRRGEGNRRPSFPSSASSSGRDHWPKS